MPEARTSIREKANGCSPAKLTRGSASPSSPAGEGLFGFHTGGEENENDLVITIILSALLLEGEKGKNEGLLSIAEK